MNRCPPGSRPRSSSLALALLGVLAAGAAGARDLAPFDALSRAPVARSAAATLPGVDLDPRLRVPRFLWGSSVPAPAPALTAKRALDPEAGARAVLRDLARTYRITPAEVDALPMHDVQRLPGGGAVVRFAGRVGGVDVFREEVNVLLDAQGGLVAVSGHALGAPAVAKAAEVEPFAAGPGPAIATALADWGFAPADAREAALAAADGDGYATYTLPAAARGDHGAALAIPIRVKRVLYRMPDDLVPAYYLEVQVQDAADAGAIDAYAYVVAAADGRLLFRNTLTRDAAYTYRVHAEPTSPYLPLPGPMGRAAFPYPSATPDGMQPPLGPGNLITLENAPFSRNDPWLAGLNPRTGGNNVEAFSDKLSPDGFGTPGTDECNINLPVDGDLHACMTSGSTFDHVYDFSKAPDANRTQVSAAVTNLFYTVNWLHDWFYDAGFDEAARNAQTNNFNRGGVGNDSIIAQVQDFSGTNNANMSTPADGGRPRMRQMVWNSAIALARVQSPPAIAGNTPAGKADFGATSFDLTGPVVAALDPDDTTGPSTTDGCSAYTNAGAVAGKIALVDRGTCLFVDKAKLAQAAGAVALVVANNVSGSAPNMAGTDASITIPIVGLTQAAGAAIRAQLANGVTLRIARRADVNRDGALDNSLVAHEWGHYLSNRLIGNGSGLATNQAGGMGEGWSDFVALLLLVKDADRNVPGNAGFDGTYSVTQYPEGGPDFAPDLLNYGYYYGIRRYPYTRDTSRNPLTFRHIGDGNALPATPPMSPTGSTSANSEVHNTGEVWASMLWECYSNLLNDTPRLTFAQAQDRMKRYLVASLKMTPTDPTFIEARDALLAVMQAQDASDRDRCMEGFAKRGAGVGAVAPDRLSETNAGVVESFRATADVPLPAPVIEYYHAAFDHYFVTGIADEIAKLDNGTFAGWARTGESFKAYAAGTPGAADVCRFFSTSFAPKSSHFYTPSASECTTVKNNPNWQFEAVVFGVPTPDSAGNCAAGTQPLYRLYNNGQGAAPNHRYTTSLATRQAMLAKGWIPEGNGALGVIACSPL